MNLRTRTGKISALLAAVPLLVVGIAGAATADNISNSLDASVDAVAEVMPLNVGGANGTTTLYVVPTGGDGKNGCNLTGGTSLQLSVSSSNTTVATVSPSSVTFSSCGDVKTLTVTPHEAGTASITAAQTSNSTGGTFNLAPATFTVNVAPPANTAPKIAVSGVTGGASYDKGSVPAATCQVTDAEDGNSSFPATLSAVTGPNSADGIGSQTASCSYTDKGGLEASASETYSIVDPSAPAISYVLNPASPDGQNGWYTGDVTLSWTVDEPESPNSLVKTGCVDQNITADQSEQNYKCSATSAGGSATEQSVTIKRDSTGPVVKSDGVVAGTLGANGWYTSSVTVGFSATDALSGVTAASKTVDVTEEGTTTVKSPEFTDNAGNTTAAGEASEQVKIDKTAPTVSLVGGPSDGASYYYGDVPAAPTCSASDATSGIDGACAVSDYSGAVGEHTVTASVKDKAGNPGSASRTYTVLAWTPKGFYSPVDMGGTVNTVKAGSTVPLKFEVFSGSKELIDASAVKSFVVKSTNLPTNVVFDDIEQLSTGGTSLRYDLTAGQFVQNWQTPKMAGAAFVATVTLQDGSSISANFKLK